MLQYPPLRARSNYRVSVEYGLSVSVFFFAEKGFNYLSDETNRCFVLVRKLNTSRFLIFI